MTEGQVTIRPTEDGGLLIHVPMLVRRRGGRRLIIAPEGLDSASTDDRPANQERLVSILARAHAWTRLLDNGHFKSTGQLAAAVKKDPSYVARVLRLATLAPDITQAILDGREPDGLSYMKLVKVLSYDWDEQREALGFAVPE